MIEQAQSEASSLRSTNWCGEWALLSAHLPGHAGLPIGICIRSQGNESIGVHIRLRENWWLGLVDSEEHDFWESLHIELLAAVRMIEPERLWNWLQSTPSNVLRCEIHQISTSGSENTASLVDSLYRTYVVGTSFSC